MLKISNLKKSYGAKNILNGVELHIAKDEILGFVGANGAGKTTTLNSKDNAQYLPMYSNQL